jgi:hypothetical protein
MRRFLLLAATLGMLALVVWWAPARQGHPDPLTALGGSLGGGRVAVINLLFVRAERLNREGRYEELPALYESIRRLDPQNTAAADHLAAIYAYDVLREAPDDAARLGWWLEAWELVEGALREHPNDASLLTRSTDLLLDIAPRYPGLEDAIAAKVGDPRQLGVARLLAAARLTRVLPRRGRIHLLRLVILLPIVAAQDLGAGGEAWRPLLAAGEEVAALRRSDLAAMHLPTEEAGSGPTLDVVFQARLAAVSGVGDALARADREGAERAIQAYAELDPASRLEDVLQRVVGAR